VSHPEVSTITNRRSRLRTAGVAPRLLVLVLVPLLGLLLFAASAVALRSDANDQAGEIRHDVDRIARLAEVRSTLFQERVPSDSATTLRRLGISLSNANFLFKTSVEEQLTTTRRATDDAVTALNEPAVVSMADVAAVRALADHPTESFSPGESFQPIEQRLDGAIGTTLAHAQTRLPLVPGVSEVGEALRASQRSIEIIDATLTQMTALAKTYLQPGTDASTTWTIATARAENSVAQGELERVGMAEIADAWRDVRDSETARRFRETFDRMARGDVDRIADGAVALERMNATTTNALAYEDMLFGLMDTTIEAGRRASADVAEDAATDLRQSLLLPVPLVLIALGVSLMVARSISRPMSRLADHAARIGSGDLTVEPLRPQGPRELAVAFDAVNDLVANLKLLDAKSQALADLDFDAPVLAEPLPGRLGQVLERSLTVVSGSIDERDKLQDRLLQQASQDVLTGVLNRAAAADDLEQALLRSRRLSEGVAVLHLDLDDFKRVNDSHGQAAGDGVLVETARRLRRVTGGEALIARLGGDEFLVVVEGVTDPGEVDDLAHRLRAALGQPVPGVLTTGGIGVSIGIAFAWDGSDAASDVLAWAEMAVHRAKQRAAGSIEIYDEGLQQKLRELAEIEDALTAALPRDELFLQYQPVIDLATGRMSSVEALVRWQRPDVGMQPPDSFIPVAERSDLIVSLDNWVMKRAARQMNEWADRTDLTDIQVAINVSGRHLLSQTLYDHVVELLDTTGIAPRRLVVEITETVLVNDLVAAAAQLEAVRGLGVRIALDDFGTGYTSITHLRQLPIDIIKIDRSFVQRLGNERDRTLLAMITDLGHHLGLTITAEGVETAEQYELLRAMGCDRAQGYHMSRPLAPDALATWALHQAGTPERAIAN
jgi:diguanylate cyclase (GGDEF)-like protein